VTLGQLKYCFFNKINQLTVILAQLYKKNAAATDNTTVQLVTFTPYSVVKILK